MPRQPKAGRANRLRTDILDDVRKRSEEASARLFECIDALVAEGLPNSAASGFFRSMASFVFGPDWQYSAPGVKDAVPSLKINAHVDVRNTETPGPVASKRGRERKGNPSVRADVRSGETAKPIASKRARERKGKVSSNSPTKEVPSITPVIKKPPKKKSNGRRKLNSVTSSSEASAPESPQEKVIDVIEIEDSPAQNDPAIPAPRDDLVADRNVPESDDEVSKLKKSLNVVDDGRSSDQQGNELETMRDSDDTRFAVGKDGHISEATISHFKGLSTGSSKISVDKATTAKKSNRLFSNGASSSRIKPPTGKPTMLTAGSQTETRLASKTPGMRKLDFGVGKPPRPDPKAAFDRSIAGSLFPMPGKGKKFSADDVDLMNPVSTGIDSEAQKSLSNVPPEKEAFDVDEPEDRNGSSKRQEFVDIQVEVPCISDKKDVANDQEDSIEETRNPILEKECVEKNATNEEPEAKSKLSLEPLFPRGLFADPSPPRPKPKKKSISFAPQVVDLDEKAEQAKKRPAEEEKLETNSSKRHRSDEPPQRSELRQKIENMRLRFSQKTVDTPAHQDMVEAPDTMDHELPETSQFPSQSTDDEHTKSSGFYSAKSLQARIDDVEDAPHVDDGFGLRTPITGTESRPSMAQTPLSIETPAVALESKFNAASPDDERAVDVQDKDGDEVMRDGAEKSTAGDSGVLGNLYTSVKSLLPNSSSLFGFPVDNQSPEVESESAKAKRLEERQRIDDERREAEMIAKREAAKAVRQAEARAKQRKVEENRKAQEEEKRRREEAQKQKNVERALQLRKQLEERKRVKAENERKREERRKRVLEHQEKVKAAEAAKRADLERRFNQERGLTSTKVGSKQVKAGGLAGLSVPGSTKKQRPGAGSSATPAPVRKKSEEITSYEMSAERDRGTEGDSDSDAEEMAKRKGKKIPEWAQKENVWKALEQQTGDPDKHFSRVQSVNLEDVFASTQQNKVRYRSRNSSGQWTKDRLTAKEEMEYKKKAGYI